MKLKVRIIFTILIIGGILIILIGFPPTIPPPTSPGEQLATEVSFSRGIRLDVAVNDTTPRVGDTVCVVIQITNVNSSEQVGYPNCAIRMIVRNSKGEGVYPYFEYFCPQMTMFPSFPVNQTIREVRKWKVETSPDSPVEVKRGESYYIAVTCRLWKSDKSSFFVSINPIKVEVR